MASKRKYNPEVLQPFGKMPDSYNLFRNSYNLSYNLGFLDCHTTITTFTTILANFLAFWGNFLQPLRPLQPFLKSFVNIYQNGCSKSYNLYNLCALNLF